MLTPSEPPGSQLWPGGPGGVIGILYSLYWHVVIQRDFVRQHMMYYLVQPIIGFVLGAMVYLTITTIFFLFESVVHQAPSNDILASPTIIATQVLFGWMAGFRQRFVLEMIERIGQRPTQETEEDDKTETSTTTKQFEKVLPPITTEGSNTSDSSYTWGLFVFFYASVWLIVFIAGLLFRDQLSALGGTSTTTDAIQTGWLTAIAGGVGGVIRILHKLSWHVSLKQDFDRRYTMYYLVEPVLGFLLGAVVYFIISAGFLTFAGPTDVLASPATITIQIVFGWVVGFRQRYVFEMIDKIAQRISPKGKDNS
ncbi:hypothetical protein ACFLXQ_02455 [Chloroflexota bacterium]